MRSTLACLAASGALALAVTVGLPQAAGASTSTPRATSTTRPNTATLLYSQDNDASGYGLVSQNFGKGNTEDAQSADDFTVPKGKTWAITEVKVDGFYSSGSGPAASENVFFYKTVVKNKHDIPGTLVKKVTLKGTGAKGAFVISGITGVSLATGHYWVSVQANMTSGEWYWASRTKQGGSPAVWKNPGNGFGSGCTTWTPYQSCTGASGRPDFMWALYGTSKS